MESPYTAPSSELIDAGSKRPSKGKWKFFFWLSLVLESLAVVSMLFDLEHNAIAELLAEAVVYTVILTGLYGYAYDKKIGQQRLWGAVIPLGLAWDIFFMASTILAIDGGDPMELYITIGALVLFSPLWIFQYLALFRYRFRSPEIWQ
jgi:hypothetical protein